MNDYGAFAGAMGGSVVDPSEIVRMITYQPILDPFNPLLFLVALTVSLAWLYHRSLGRKQKERTALLSGWDLPAEMERAITEHSLQTAEIHRLQIELQRARQECQRLGGLLVQARSQAEQRPKETKEASSQVAQAAVETTEVATQATATAAECGECATAKTALELAERSLEQRQGLLDVTQRHCEALQGEVSNCRAMLKMLPKQAAIVKLELEATSMKEAVARLNTAVQRKDEQLTDERKQRQEAFTKALALERKAAAAERKLQAAVERRAAAEEDTRVCMARYAELCRVLESIAAQRKAAEPTTFEAAKPAPSSGTATVAIAPIVAPRIEARQKPAAQPQQQPRICWADSVDDEPINFNTPVDAAEVCTPTPVAAPGTLAAAIEQLQTRQPELYAAATSALPPVDNQLSFEAAPTQLSEQQRDVSRRYCSAARDPEMRARWDYVLSCVMGRLCEVQLKDGTRYQGVFHSKTPGEFSIKVAQARLMASPVHGPEMRTNPRTSVRIQTCDIVHLSCGEAPLDPTATGADVE